MMGQGTGGNGATLMGWIHTAMLQGVAGFHKKTLKIDEVRLKRARRILAKPTDAAMADDLLAVAGKGQGLFRPRPNG